MKNLLKKASFILAFAMAFSCILSCPAFAAQPEPDMEPIKVTVEDVENVNLRQEYDFSRVAGRNSVVYLSQGYSTFVAGRLGAGSTYTTNIYVLSKPTLEISLQSFGGASPNLNVTLYRTDLGNAVLAEARVSLPWASMAGGSDGKVVRFTNLNTAYRYYVVIQNMNTYTTQGSIEGVAKETW